MYPFSDLYLEGLEVVNPAHNGFIIEELKKFNANQPNITWWDE
jgi:hypothetical protein